MRGDRGERGTPLPYPGRSREWLAAALVKCADATQRPAEDGVPQKALYQWIVARLRGLGTLVGHQDEVRECVSRAVASTDPAALRDLAAILSYVRAASAFRLPALEPAIGSSAELDAAIARINAAAAG